MKETKFKVYLYDGILRVERYVIVQHVHQEDLINNYPSTLIIR